MRIISVVGARPQFVKASAISSQIAKHDSVQEIIVHTGQHYDTALSGVFFKELQVPKPTYNLAVGSGTHGFQTGQMLRGVEDILLANRPDWVLVYGDTNSTLAGALAAAKLCTPVAHIEAGMRSFDRRQPEEINRLVTDHVSDVLFTPTSVASENLRREGIANGRIHQVGDVMYDVILSFSAQAERKSRILNDLALQSKPYILATIHRADNTDKPDRLRALLHALAEAARRHPVILPLHPRTKRAMLALEVPAATLRRLRIIDPVSYLDMLVLEKNACVIATDSGGVQKEAFFLGVPCITFRERTEWTELVAAGWNRLVPPGEADQMARAIFEAIGSKGTPVNEFGTGNSAARIVKTLLE
jgi:UDP-GlcNAc3NAcA epimerase